VAVKSRNLILRTSTSHSRERNREVRRAASTEHDCTQKCTHIEYSRCSSKERRSASTERGHRPHMRSNIETSRQSSKERRASYEGSYEHSLYQRSVQLAHGQRRSSQERREVRTEPSRRSNEQGLGFQDVHRYFVGTTLCDPHHRPNRERLPDHVTDHHHGPSRKGHHHHHHHHHPENSSNGSNFEEYALKKRNVSHCF
jgi:hypothetical protein